MKKKIICLVSAITLSFILFCVSASAAVQNFNDVISLSYVNVSGLTLNTDYKREIITTDYYIESKAYAVEQGVPNIQLFYCLFYFKIPSDDGSSHILGSSDAPFYSGDYIHAKFNFKLYCDFRDGTIPDIDYIVPRMKFSSSQDEWNYSNLPVVGNIEYTDFKQDSSGDWYTDCTAYISYKNTGETIDNFNCRFLIYVRGKTARPFYASVYTYTPYVYEFYYGDGSESDAPIYSSPNDSYGSDIDSNKENIDDYVDEEQELLDKTENGRNEAHQLFNNFGDTVASLSTSLLAVTYGLNYFIGSSHLLHSILYISLTLGFVLFIFNVVPSLSHSRSRSETRENKAGKKGDGG